MNTNKIVINSYLGYESSLIMDSIKKISFNSVEVAIRSPFSLNQKNDETQVAVIVDPINLIPYHCLRLFESKKENYHSDKVIDGILMKYFKIYNKSLKVFEVYKSHVTICHFEDAYNLPKYLFPNIPIDFSKISLKEDFESVYSYKDIKLEQGVIDKVFDVFYGNQDFFDMRSIYLNFVKSSNLLKI